MDLWHIFVLATVRLGLDIDYDKLEDLANHHKLLSQKTQLIFFDMSAISLSSFE